MRMDAQTIKVLVKEFANSTRGRIWYSLGSDLREALIDAAIMDHVRMAAACEADKPMTATELADFRDTVKAALEAGVPRRGDCPRQFLVNP